MDIVLSAPQIHYELIVDKHSLPLIQGSVLDYHISLAGEYFVLQNPKKQNVAVVILFYLEN